MSGGKEEMAFAYQHSTSFACSLRGFSSLGIWKYFAQCLLQCGGLLDEDRRLTGWTSLPRGQGTFLAVQQQFEATSLKRKWEVRHAMGGD
jgi:hypothetical protein